MTGHPWGSFRLESSNWKVLGLSTIVPSLLGEEGLKVKLITNGQGYHAYAMKSERTRFRVLLDS
jgi:hypothetical protein